MIDMNEKGYKEYIENCNGIIDDNGNVLYFKGSDGIEKWYDYDENGNEIHYKDSKGYERWKEYNENGVLISYKNTDGVEWHDLKRG